jgi:quinohemoprotein ethanol dehydrogenase
MKQLFSGLALLGLAAISMAAGSQQQQDNLQQPAGRDWPVVAGDWGSTRYSTLSEITRSNVKSLGGAWFHKFEDGIGRGTPVVVDGRMYVVSTDHVHALNAKTGEPIWTTKLDAATAGFCKGVAVGEGLIFVGLGNSNIVALREDTGKQVWSVKIGDSTPTFGQYISSAPAYVNGLVLTGLANGDVPGVRGRLVALDAKTGNQVWRFNSVPDRGVKGAETWPQDRDNWRPGGGGIWITPSVDPDLGLTYVAVGNATPQFGGEIRAGDNLYTASLVALDIKTGEIRWHFQVTHHDIWDSDLSTPPILYDAAVNGKPRKAIAFVSTHGYLFMLDRANGQPIWPVEERPVPQNPRLNTSPTQPFPVGADRIGPRCIPKDSIPSGFKALCDYDPIDYDLPNAIYPIRTIRAAPMAYNPKTKHFYATGAVWPFWLKRLEDPRTWVQTSVPGLRYAGILASMDSKTNKLAWEKTVPWRLQENGSGFIATAGGLLFHGNTDGYLDAYDEKTGDQLWRFQTGSNANWPAATYAVDGEQYVSIVSDAGVWALKLNGSVAGLPAPPVPSEISTFSGRIVSTDQITMSQLVASFMGGEKFFDEYAFQPQRVSVKVGTKVTWTNTGKVPHAAEAVDGSWNTGVVAPGKAASLSFDKPGVYTYIDKQFPWTYGELTVEE